MREIVFRVLEERPGHLMARSEDGTLQVTAPTHEELPLEAREALMRQLGTAHVGWRIRFSRPQTIRSSVVRLSRPLGQGGLEPCCG